MGQGSREHHLFGEYIMILATWPSQRVKKVEKVGGIPGKMLQTEGFRES